MCGRFTLVADPDELRQAFPWLNLPEDIQPRYNIAPRQPVAVAANDGKNQLDYYTWGLIPSWAKDPQIGSRLINARAETLLEKPSFRNTFRRRRCLILASGFFEWKQQGEKKTKTPYYIHLRSGRPFAFAGLWDVWHASDGSQILSCAIITTEPNAFMAAIHNRMPVILPETAYSLWNSPGEADPKSLLNLLKPYPAAEMDAFPVSKIVNNPENNTPECILPVAA